MENVGEKLQSGREINEKLKHLSMYRFNVQGCGLKKNMCCF